MQSTTADTTRQGGERGLRLLLRAGSVLLAVLEVFRRLLRPLTDRLLGPTLSESDAQSAGVRSFELEADDVMSRQRTQRAQTIVRAGLLVMILLIVWAALARVDEVTRGDSRVIPSRQLQVVQSLDGGVVSEILVQEGQVVEAGQLLLKIDETRATSGVRESAAQGYALRARQARLRALAEGSAFKPPAIQGDPDEQRILDEERRLYESRLAQLRTQLSINEQQLAQRRQELTEARARKSAADRALDLSQQELARTRPLLATGAVSEVEVLRLQREVARARGESEQAGAQIARVQAAIGEAQRKTTETEQGFRNDARKELAEVMGRLNALNEGAVALADKVEKSQVKSPVRGRVSGCSPTPSAASSSRARTSSRSFRWTTPSCSKRACNPATSRSSRRARAPPSSSPPTTSRSTAGSTRRSRTSAPTP